MHNGPVRSDQPVTFTSDSVEYDRENSLVTASGHVEAWQNDHVLRADKVTFDRNTGVVAATGHVVLMEPDGEVLFADYAEMNQGMKDGVLRICGRSWRRTAGWPPMARGGPAAKSTRWPTSSIRRAICAKRIRQSRRSGSYALQGGAGPGAQEDRIRECRDGDVTAFRWRIFPIFGTPIRR